MTCSLSPTPGAARHGLRRALTVLRNQVGSTTEAIVATALSLLIISMIGSGTVSAVAALTTASSNAERTQELNVMAGKPQLIPGWATATSSALAHDASLPSGTVLKSYVWAVPDTTGTMYFAAAPRSGNTATSCSSISTSDTDHCVYASAFKTNDLRKTPPVELPGVTKASFASPVPARTTIASSGTLSVNTEIRFYINAAAIGSAGSLYLMQGTRVLESIPIGTVTDDYYGLISVVSGTAMTIVSPDRNVLVTRVLMYKAGS